MITANSHAASLSLDRRIGIGLRSSHIDEVMNERPQLGWLEVHCENWMCDQGPISERFQEICAAYPISLHGVGLSLGSVGDLDKSHLKKLAILVERSQPILVSEHLSWGCIAGNHSNDLLPLPYNKAAMICLINHIDQVQQCLGRQILVENLSSYCTFHESTMLECDFVRAVVEKANCGLLLDINNLFVNAYNHQFSAEDYLAAMPWDCVAEMHLAGFENENGTLVDTHSKPVHESVWSLYAKALKWAPHTARTLIEWDNDIPPLKVLLGEAAKADALLKEVAHVNA